MKSEFKIYLFIYIGFILFFLLIGFGKCEDLIVEDISIKIYPYDRLNGKYWEVCPRHVHLGKISDLSAYIEITDTAGITRNYKTSFFSFFVLNRCKKTDASGHCFKRDTPQSEREWFYNLNADGIDNILLVIKNDYENKKIFEKRFESKDLMPN